MTNGELEQYLTKALAPVYGLREARAIQRFLFRALHSLSDVEWLLIRNDEAIPEFEEAVKQSIPSLIQQMPVQYLTGKTWFCDLEFEVNQGVLIPRPETETLVMMVAEKYKDAGSLRMLDIGTGSGAIAVSLAVLLSNADVTAFDISDIALEVAAANARKHSRDIMFYKADILDAGKWPQAGCFDIIISNPPYVKESERIHMQPNVLNYEPALALFVEDQDALKYYRAIMDYAVRFLKPGGALWFEINENEGENIRRLLLERGFSHVSILKDLADKYRFAYAVIR